MAENDFFSDADFELYRSFINKESSITFTPANRSILESRLKERLREKRLDSVKAYYSMITSDKEELKNFLDSITTNLTRFFRNQPHFDALEKYVVPELIHNIKKNSGSNVIKLWSAGCSTGEEPYTIAMLLTEILPPSWRFEILVNLIPLPCCSPKFSRRHGDSKFWRAISA